MKNKRKSTKLNAHPFAALHDFPVLKPYQKMLIGISQGLGSF